MNGSIQAGADFAPDEAIMGLTPQPVESGISGIVLLSLRISLGGLGSSENERIGSVAS
jgi:hypothetical protein